MENFVSIIVSITHHGGIYESLIAGGKYKLELVYELLSLDCSPFLNEPLEESVKDCPRVDRIYI